MSKQIRRFLRFRYLTVAAVCTLALPIPLLAAPGDTAENTIINSLAPVDGEAKPKDSQKTVIQVIIEEQPRTVVVDYYFAYDLTVFFPRNSDRITDEARIQLNAIGSALISDRLLPYKYVLAGHTDATGSAEYNRDLSVRRALSVRRYLIDTFGIDPSRLVAAGWGESRLKAPEKPNSSVNRRVELVLIEKVQPVVSEVTPKVEETAEENVVVKTEPGTVVTVTVEGGANNFVAPKAVVGKVPVEKVVPRVEKANQIEAVTEECGRSGLKDPRQRAADLDDFTTGPTGSNCPNTPGRIIINQ